MKQVLLNRQVSNPPSRDSIPKLSVDNPKRWWLICLIFLIGWMGSVQETKAAWTDGNGNYFRELEWLADRGEIKITITVFDGTGANELFYNKTGGGEVSITTETLGKTVLGWAACGATDGSDITFTQQNPLGGSFYLDTENNTSNDTKQILIYWRIPTNFYHSNLTISLRGTWWYAAAGSNTWASQDRSINPSSKGGVFHPIGGDLQVASDGKLNFGWWKTNSRTSNQQVEASQMDERGEVTLHAGNNGAQLAKGTLVKGWNKGSFSHTPSQPWEPSTYSVKHKFTLTAMYFEELKQYTHPGLPYPTNIQATQDMINRKVTLNWKINNIEAAAGQGDGHWVIYRKAGSMAEEKVATVDKNIQTYVADVPEYGKEYMYYVKWVRKSWNDNTTISKLINSIKVKIDRSYTIELKATPKEFSIALAWTVPNIPIGRYSDNSGKKKAFEIWRSTKGVENSLIAHVDVVEGQRSYTCDDQHDKLTNDLGGSCTTHTYTVVAYALDAATYGAFSSSPLNAATTGNTQLLSFNAAKGSAKGAVYLNWAVKRFQKTPDTGETYVISRRVADSDGTFSEKHRFNSTETLLSWTDNTAAYGVYYEYKVTCIVTCDENNKPYSDMFDIGFAQTTGSIIGRITYGTSGTAVTGAQVLLKKQESSDFESAQYHSLQFDNTGYALLNKDAAFIPDKKDVTIQCYINPDKEQETHTSLLKLGNIRFGLKRNAAQTGFNPTIQIGNEPAASFSNITVPVDRYSHIAIGKSGSKYTFSLVNDTAATVKVVSQELSAGSSGSGQLTLQLGGNQANSYKGYIDELRVWSNSLGEAAILDNYSRILTGSETNLIGYWRLDEGLKTQFFDYSNISGDFNNNHGTIHSSAYPATNIPFDTQLGLKGITDHNGSYTIVGIPFSGDGTMYNVVPSLGVHQFNPSSKNLQISSSSLVMNDQTFTDISSFQVRGRVTYKHGNFPSENVSILVDGLAATRDNLPVTSDGNGEFVVDVPIGMHTISLSKQGHTFEDGGRFPKKGNEKYDFQTNITEQIEFTDNTVVRIAGRATGGSVEAAKPLGFGVSKANIGKASIVLEPVSSMDYRLNTTENDAVLAGNDTIKSTVKLLKNSKRISIETDPATGEFLALLPPISYKVAAAQTNSVEEKLFRLESIAQISPDVNSTKQDTLTAENGSKQSFNYHERLDFSYIAPAILEVKDAGNAEGAFGEKEYTATYKTGGDNETEKEVKIPLYTGTGNAVNYTLEYPVFVKNKAYKFSLKAYEMYENKDKNTVVSSQVPLSGVTIVADDKISMSEYYVNKDSIMQQPSVVTLDERGIGIYTFQGGLPNLNDDMLKAMQFTFNKNGQMFQWKDSEFKAFVLGDTPNAGQSFITTGPDQVDFVLRDPGGSNSYSYLAKGSVITSTESNLSAEGTALEQGFTVSFGGDVYLMQAPMGIGIMMKTDIVADVNQKFNFDYTTTNSTETSSTLEIANTISTSGEPDYVGAMADVFIGRSSNILFGASNNLGFYRDRPADTDKTPIIKTVTADGKEFHLYKKEALSIGVRFATQFAYTQNHIQGYLIPEIEKLRNSMINADEVYPTEAGLPVRPDSCYHYYTRVAVDDPNFGKEGNYWAVEPSKDPKFKRSTPVTDEVSECNSWIKGWVKHLAQNETDKLNAFATTAIVNESFDAGAIKEHSIIKTTGKGVSKDITWNTDISLENTTGFEMLGVGAKTQIKLGYKHQSGKSSDSTKVQSVEVGYVLADPNQGDTHTIDVYTGKEHQTGADTLIKVSAQEFIFRTRAGQTSCPWEAGEMTRYQKGEQKELSTATLQIEKPALSITNSTKVDIPNGRETSFELKMSNNSEANLAVTYLLWVDDATNPDGLALFIDGQSLGNGRQFAIESGKTLTKILVVKQTVLDKMEYKDVMLHLTSTCQNDPNADMGWIHADAKFNVQFKPASSPLTLNIENKNKVLNSVTGNELSMEVTDFNREFSGLKFIHLKYKPANAHSATWTTLKSYAIHAKDANEKIELIEANTLYYSLEMDNTTYPDQSYLLCAFSESEDKTEAQSEEVLVIKDMKGPQILGNPSPSNGILTPDGDISVIFNEPINTSIIINDNIQAKGVLNGHKLAHNTGLSFTQGAEPAITELPIILSGNSFTLETWMKHTPGTSGTIFRHGTGDNSLVISYTQNEQKADLLKIVVNGQQFLSPPLERVTGWRYLSVSYDADDNTISANMLYDATSLTAIHLAQLATPYSGNGRLYVGGDFSGVLQEVTLWSVARGMSDLSDKDKDKSSNEKNLIGYWKMDECSGLVAADKVRARHLIVPNASNWYVGTENIAYAFDGNGHIQINTATIPVSSDENFAIEFWFKGDASKQSDATLFSCGKGKDEYDGKHKLSVGFANNKLMLHAAGQSYPLGDKSYLDNNWHHFALNVVRTGTANAYVDGVAIKSLNASLIGGMQNATILLGACQYRMTENEPEGGPQYATDSYFIGSMDEVRIWKATLGAENIRLNMNSRLKGDEAGLIAYYPFEEITKESGVAEVTASLKDKTQANVEAIGTNVTSSKIAPNLKEVRELESLPITFVTSERQISIKLQEGMISRIENCTVEFTLDRIQDLNGNPLPGAIKWAAFVNMNRMKWDRSQVSVVQEVLKAETFEVLISNQSGKSESYVLSNLPGWLKASKEQGNLNATSSEKIRFTVAESTPIGNYESTIYLTGSNDVAEPLSVSLKVTGTKPNWAVNANDYEHSMSLVGQLTLEGQMQEDSEDMVAAFIGDECVGVISPKFSKELNGYYLYMSIYGNKLHAGKEVTFRLWDAGTGRIYPHLETSITPITFGDGGIVGSIRKPVIINALDRIEQSMPVKKGWNWLSVNVSPVEGVADNFKQFETTIGTSGVTLKGRTIYSEYSRNNWKGSLTALLASDMYMLEATGTATLKFVGKAINPTATPITLNPGWSWIGYTPQFSADLKEALAGLTNPKVDDILKGQNTFAMFNGTQWIGSLEYLEAGRGYMYHSTDGTAKAFVYPSKSASVKQSLRSAKASILKWSADANKFASNMTLIGQVMLNNQEVTEGEYELGIFQGNECRGSVLLDHNKELGQSLAYLTIHGANNDQLTFRLYDHATGTEMRAISPENLTYKADGHVGVLSMPYLINFSGATSIDGMLEGRYSAYPTRVDHRIWFNYSPDMIEQLEVVHSNGAVVIRMNKVTDNFVDVSKLTAGVCYLRITYQGKVYVHEFIKK